MLKARAALLGLACFLFAGGACIGPTQAAGGWSNPFCGGLVTLIPWDARADAPATKLLSDRYVLEMFADGKQDVEGAVTLVTADEAYSIPIARTDLLRQGGTDDFYAEPVVVAFDKPVEVRFAFVDRIGVDGAAPAACPSVVQPVQALSSKDAAGVPSLGYIKPLHATFLQKLPALRCGASYIPPDTPRDAGGIVGRYGNVRKTTVVHVYVDSNGIPSGATVERSSGIDGLDSAAVGAVEHTRYSPARFLCTPVVSEMNVEMEYDP